MKLFETIRKIFRKESKKRPEPCEAYIGTLRPDKEGIAVTMERTTEKTSEVSEGFRDISRRIDHTNDALDAMTFAFWANGRVFETVTPNEIREMYRITPMAGSNVTKNRKHCEYCGVLQDKEYGTCPHCGAPIR